MPFFHDPTLVLKTQADTEAALLDTSWMERPHPFSWRVKSDWIISLIDECEATRGFAYNAAVVELAAERMGWPEPKKCPTEGTPLSRLVYNGQRFRDHDQLIAAGFRPLTVDMLQEAGIGGKIQFPGGSVANVRRIEGKTYLMLPRKRRFAIAIQGQPAKPLPRLKLTSGKPEPLFA